MKLWPLHVQRGSIHLKRYGRYKLREGVRQSREAKKERRERQKGSLLNTYKQQQGKEDACQHRGINGQSQLSQPYSACSQETEQEAGKSHARQGHDFKEKLLTFPLLYRKLFMFQRIIIGLLCFCLLLDVSELFEIRVGQCLCGRKALFHVQLQHLVKQVHCCRRRQKHG